MAKKKTVDVNEKIINNMIKLHFIDVVNNINK